MTDSRRRLFCTALTAFSLVGGTAGAQVTSRPRIEPHVIRLGVHLHANPAVRAALVELSRSIEHGTVGALRVSIGTYNTSDTWGPTGWPATPGNFDGIVTIFGTSDELCPRVVGLEAPSMFDSAEAYDYVFPQVRAELEQGCRPGVTPIGWYESGPRRLVDVYPRRAASVTPIAMPADLARFTSPDHITQLASHAFTGFHTGGPLWGYTMLLAPQDAITLRHPSTTSSWSTLDVDMGVAPDMIAMSSTFMQSLPPDRQRVLRTAVATVTENLTRQLRTHWNSAWNTVRSRPADFNVVALNDAQRAAWRTYTQGVDRQYAAMSGGVGGLYTRVRAMLQAMPADAGAPDASGPTDASVAIAPTPADASVTTPTTRANADAAVTPPRVTRPTVSAPSVGRPAQDAGQR